MLPSDLRHQTCAEIFIVGVVRIHSTTIFVVAIVCVIRDLSACESRFLLLLSALFFVMVELSTISAFDCVLMARARVKAPPSCKGSSMASVLRSRLGVVFLGRTLSALFSVESASRSSTSSSSVRVHVVHVAFRCITPCTHVVFFDQQHRLKLKEGGRFLPC